MTNPLDIHTVITDARTLAQNYILRDGFAFTALAPANVYDAIVIRQKPVLREEFGVPRTARTLAEHIALIQEERLEKAVIHASDLSFLTQCPSLKYLSIMPDEDAGDGFDYSPLYAMPEIRSLTCITEYGEREQLRTEVDYGCIRGLEHLGVAGTGHRNYGSVETLKSLGVSRGTFEDLRGICGKSLDSLALLACRIRSLEGLEAAPGLQCLYLDHNRALRDISGLRAVKGTLKALRVECCPKIEDFSVLGELEQLEFLELTGSNVLPGLDFLGTMGKLKTFVFDMNVQNGDLTPCLRLDYARCLRNRRHFNRKDAELPKGTYVHGDAGIPLWRRLE